MNDLAEKTRDLFAEYDNPDSPGCVLSVVNDGAIIHSRGYGMADLDCAIPIMPNTCFDVASMSKQFTAACVLMLSQDGKLSLDSPVGAYLVDFPSYGDGITVGHLVYHTSGLRDYPDLWALMGRSMEEHFSNGDAHALLSRQKSLNFPPGTREAYCNAGYVVLAQLVERLSGESLRRFAQRRIFEPLCMRDTFFDDGEGQTLADVAVGYVPKEGGFEKQSNQFRCMGPSGLVTTVEDLFLWDQNFYEPKVGGPGFADTMTTCGSLDDGEELGYALGLQVGSYRGEQIVLHGGYANGYCSEMVQFPNQRLTIVCLGNVSTLDRPRIWKRVADICLEDVFGTREFEGEYRSEELGSTVGVIAEDAMLFVKAKNAPTDPMAPQEDKNHFRSGPVDIHFIRDSQNSVTGLKLSSIGAKNIAYVKTGANFS